MMTSPKAVSVSLHKHMTPPPSPPAPDKKRRVDIELSSSDPDSVKRAAKPGESPPPALVSHLTKDDFERRNGTLENGQIVFLYRPKVDLDTPHSLDDVQRFFMLLLPEEPAGSWRLINVGRKHLPEHNDRNMKRPETFWGLVVAVGSDMSALKDSLGPKEYETKTHGTRTVGAARVAGTGSYLLHSTRDPKALEDSKNASAVYTTRLAYALALPHKLGDVQAELNLHSEGAFQLQIKNPETESTNPRVRDQPENCRPQYPEQLAEYFTTRWIPANPAALLNYPGCEVLLVPGKHSVLDEIGDEAEKTMLQEAHEVVKSHVKQEDIKEEDDAEHAEVMAILREFGLDGLIEGLALEGHWE